MPVQIEKKVLSFFSQSKKQTYKKGHILIRSDEKPSGVFYIEKGAVKVYTISKKGNEIILNLFKEKSFFPMSWAINNTQNTFFYEATTEVKAYKCSQQKILDFVKENPDILYDLLSRVYLGTDGLLKKISYLMSGNANSRLVAELEMLAKRFGRITEKGVEIQISEKDIASQTGMTRETISRELKNLKEKKIVNVRRNSITVIDSDKFNNEFLIGL